MNKQSVEQLRDQLLANNEVRSTIARRAFEIYENRGGETGSALDDWLNAENEILTVLIEQQFSGEALEPSGAAETEEIVNQIDLPVAEAGTELKRKARG